MATLALKNIYKIYEDEVTAVSNFNLELLMCKTTSN